MKLVLIAALVLIVPALLAAAVEQVKFKERKRQPTNDLYPFHPAAPAASKAVQRRALLVFRVLCAAAVMVMHLALILVAYGQDQNLE